MPGRILAPFLGLPLVIAVAVHARQSAAPQGPAAAPGVARVDALLAAGKTSITVREYNRKSNDLPGGFSITAAAVAECDRGDADACGEDGNAFGMVKSQSGDPTLLAAQIGSGCRVAKPEICDRLNHYAELFWARACVLDSTRCTLLGEELEAMGDIPAERHLFEVTRNDVDLARSYEIFVPRDPEKALALYRSNCTGSSNWRAEKRACQALIKANQGDDQAERNLGLAERRADFQPRREEVERQLKIEQAALDQAQRTADEREMGATADAEVLTNSIYLQRGADDAKADAELHRRNVERLRDELQLIKEEQGE